MVCHTVLATYPCPEGTLPLLQELQSLLRTRNEFIDLRLNLVCEVGFIPPDSAFVNEKEYL